METCKILFEKGLSFREFTVIFDVKQKIEAKVRQVELVFCNKELRLEQLLESLADSFKTSENLLTVFRRVGADFQYLPFIRILCKIIFVTF